MPLYVFTIFTHFGWWADDLQKAFGKHLATYGGLDICINSAGIGSKIVFHKDQTDGAQTWRRIIDVNLLAVMACTQLAVCIHMGLGFHHTFTMKLTCRYQIFAIWLAWWNLLVLLFGLLVNRKFYSLDAWIFNKFTLTFNSCKHYVFHLWLELW